MIYFIKSLYTVFLLPPGIFIVIFAVLSVYLFIKKNKFYKILSILTLLFYICTTGAFSNAVIRSLEKKHTPPQNPSGDVIIMLGGGALSDTPGVSGQGSLSGFAANRLITTAQLYKKLNIPIIISGGQVYTNTGIESHIAKKILISMGIPEDMIISEDKSLNTSQNAEYSKKILVKFGFTHPILVTSAFHMERAIRQFNKFNVNVEAYPTDYQTNVTGKFALQDLLPDGSSIEKLSISIKEYLGIMASSKY